MIDDCQCIPHEVGAVEFLEIHALECISNGAGMLQFSESREDQEQDVNPVVLQEFERFARLVSRLRVTDEDCIDTELNEIRYVFLQFRKPIVAQRVNVGFVTETTDAGLPRIIVDTFDEELFRSTMGR